jgi:polysaccharide export outer membrane protein
MLKTAQKIGLKCRVFVLPVSRGAGLLLVLGLLSSFLGCSTTSSSSGNFESSSPGLSAGEQKAVAEARAAAKDTKPVNSESVVLREGDTIRVSFPGAPNLNVVQPIRRDGKISLALVGEVQAAGKTPLTLEKELVELYGPQLQDKEVNVNLENSSFPVYVTGAVLRPGKIMADRPLKLLEAIMEAGGFDYTKANTKTVRIIRGNEHFQVNLRNVLDGKNTDTFDLKPSDIVYVPERFAWF